MALVQINYDGIEKKRQKLNEERKDYKTINTSKANISRRLPNQPKKSSPKVFYLIILIGFAVISYGLFPDWQAVILTATEIILVEVFGVSLSSIGFLGVFKAISSNTKQQN